MENIDLFSLICIIIGATMVYGSKFIFKLLKINSDDIKTIALKLVGLIIACIGFFRILDII